jgi:hypothetical protein
MVLRRDSIGCQTRWMARRAYRPACRHKEGCEKGQLLPKSGKSGRIEHCAEVGSKGEEVALALFPARVQILRNGGGLTATLAKVSSRVFERRTAGAEEVKDGC